MNDLDDRLAAWNPVPAEDMLQAASSADAARLLHRILDQPVTSPPRRHAYRSRWRARAWIAAAAAAAVTIAGIVANQINAPTVSAGHRVVGFQHGPSLGVASNAVELVDYATRSAALAPVFVPGPRDWEYLETFYGLGSAGPDAVGDAQTWQQVGASRFAASWHHGKLTYGTGGGPWAQLIGWPGPSWTNMYQYLASLPPQPTALRKIILANNHGDPGAALQAIEGILGNFPVPARFQAELYAVLVSLPGVHFTRHAVDAAGRPGVGMWYRIQNDYLEEVIVNPRTYVYMGLLSIAVRGDLSYGTLLADPSRGTIIGSVAILDSGIVSRPGQVP